MAKRTCLYVVCLLSFPCVFAGFVVGFACPVWVIAGSTSKGLWQECKVVFKDCTAAGFLDGPVLLVWIRLVEILALVMLLVAMGEIVYENATGFTRRGRTDRLASGFCGVIGGALGLAGVLMYALNTTVTHDTRYGWALFLVTTGSGLAVVLGVGFLVSGCVLEQSGEEDSRKKPTDAFRASFDTTQSPPGGQSRAMEMTTLATGNIYHDIPTRSTENSAVYAGAIRTGVPSHHSQWNETPASIFPAHRGLAPIQEQPTPDRPADPSPDYALTDSFYHDHHPVYRQPHDNFAYSRDEHFERRGLRQSMPLRVNHVYPQLENIEGAPRRWEEERYPDHVTRGPRPMTTGGSDHPWRHSRQGEAMRGYVHAQDNVRRSGRF